MCEIGKIKALCCSALLTLSCVAHGTVSNATIANLVEKEADRVVTAQQVRNNPKQRVRIDVTAPDPRLRLADCAHTPSVKLQSEKGVGRTTAKVSCGRPSPWSLYVPVNIKIYKKVVVAATPLGRGQQLTSNQLSLAEREVSTVSQGYFSNLHAAVGLQLKRPVNIGAVITPQFVEEPKVVKKGDELQVIANKGPLAIRSSGVALADGRKGDQIRVQNTRSKRVFKARIMDKGVVAVAM